MSFFGSFSPFVQTAVLLPCGALPPTLWQPSRSRYLCSTPLAAISNLGRNMLRSSDEDLELPFVEYLHALYRGPDLLSVGAPAANFVQHTGRDPFLGPR